MPNASKELISRLNTVLKNKLTGINQYFLHARMLKHQGDLKLADYEFKSSIDIMKHSDMLVELILSHGGIPNLQELGKLAIGETPMEMLANDLQLCETTLADTKLALEASDAQSAAILRKIMETQQEHIDFIHAQLNALQSTKKDVA